MPTLRNPTEYRLSCPRLGDGFIDPGESVEITDEQADELQDGPVFIVERGAPKRETVKRGGKRAEVTKAPERETRAQGMTTGNSLP
jgi:hypothetical protein